MDQDQQAAAPDPNAPNTEGASHELQAEQFFASLFALSQPGNPTPVSAQDSDDEYSDFQYEHEASTDHDAEHEHDHVDEEQADEWDQDPEEDQGFEGDHAPEAPAEWEPAPNPVQHAIDQVANLFNLPTMLSPEQQLDLFPWMGPETTPSGPGIKTLEDKLLKLRFLEEWHTLFLSEHDGERYDFLSKALLHSQMVRARLSVDLEHGIFGMVKDAAFFPDVENLGPPHTRIPTWSAFDFIPTARKSPDTARQSPEISEAQHYQYIMHCAWSERCKLVGSPPPSLADMLKNTLLGLQHLAGYYLVYNYTPSCDMYIHRDDRCGSHGWSEAVPNRHMKALRFKNDQISHVEWTIPQMAHGTLDSRDVIAIEAEESHARFRQILKSLYQEFQQEQNDLLRCPGLSRDEFESAFEEVVESQRQRIDALTEQRQIQMDNEEERAKERWKARRGFAYHDGRTQEEIDHDDSECYKPNLMRWATSDRKERRPLIKCRICFQEIRWMRIPCTGREKEHYTEFPCGHIFGLNCVKAMCDDPEWKPACPICRREPYRGFRKHTQETYERIAKIEVGLHFTDWFRMRTPEEAREDACYGSETLECERQKMDTVLGKRKREDEMHRVRY